MKAFEVSYDPKAEVSKRVSIKVNGKEIDKKNLYKIEYVICADEVPDLKLSYHAHDIGFRAMELHGEYPHLNVVKQIDRH